MLTLSLIIPVYNEERHIEACLDAVAKQSVMPNEVLVIDNNCTDKTITIAKKYPFVKVIKEKNQGLIAARNKGFETANGNVYGRIDADSIIDNNWVETVLETLISQPHIHAVTGLARTYLFPFLKDYTATTISKSYLRYVEADYGISILWGANMALRSDAWNKIKEDVSLDDTGVHEDQDISCCLSLHNLSATRNNVLLMRSIDDSLTYLPKFIEYDKRRVRTKKLHISKGSIGFSKRTVRNPIKVVLGLTLGNIFRLYFWVGGTILLALQRK